MNNPEVNGHILWTNEELQDRHGTLLFELVVEKGFSICKKCAAKEEELSLVCEKKGIEKEESVSPEECRKMVGAVMAKLSHFPIWEIKGMSHAMIFYVHSIRENYGKDNDNCRFLLDGKLPTFKKINGGYQLGLPYEEKQGLEV